MLLLCIGKGDVVIAPRFCGGGLYPCRHILWGHLHGGMLIDGDQPLRHLAKGVAVIGNVDFRLLGRQILDRAADQRHFAFKPCERLCRRIGFLFGIQGQ